MLAGLPSISFGSASTWVGGTSTDWNLAANWSAGIPTSGTATINSVPANICTITANPSVAPNDVAVGVAAGTTGRVDHRAGTLTQGVIGSTGNWVFIGGGNATGVGTYNLADTSVTGQANLTTFGQGSGSLTIGKLWVGGRDNAAGTGTVNINTTGTISAQSTGSGQAASVIIGSQGGTGTLNMDSGTINAAGELWMGNQTGTGTLNVGGTVNVTGATRVTRGASNTSLTLGTLNVNNGGTYNSENDLMLAFAGSGASTGTVNIASGGIVNVATATTRWLIMNQWDPINATLNVNGGTLNLNANTALQFGIGNNCSGNVVLNLNSGAITMWSGNKTGAGSTGVINLNNAGSTGCKSTVNLNGGTLTVGRVIASSTAGTRVFNFNGGTLKPTAASTTFFASGVASAANVRDGGATIDTDGKDITIAQALVQSTVSGDAGTGGLTKNGNGKLTLTGANTYNGNTTISAGTLALSGSGSIDSSPNIIVGSGATYDVSAVAGTLAAGQNILGGGAVNGLLTTSVTSKIIPGTDGTADTLTFDTGLSMTAGSTFNFDISSSASSGNDKVLVTGTLTLDATVFYIKGPGTLAQSDYTLATATTSITGTPTVTWVGAAPSNIGTFTVVNDGTSVKLHFLGAPVIVSAAANPTSVTRNQPTLITATVTPGTIGNVASVTVSLAGSPTASLAHTGDDGGNQIWTGNFTPSSSTALGGQILTVIAANDSVPTPFTGSGSVGITLTAANQVWDGGAAPDNKWSSNTNWLSDAGPGLSGDSVTFAGPASTLPDMDANYSVTALTFDAGASSFTIGSSTGSTLTLASPGGVLNSSVNPQTINVPVTLSAAQSFNAEGGDLMVGKNINSGGNLITVLGAANTTISGAVSGGGSLFKQDGGVLTISSNSAWAQAQASSGGFSGPLIAQAGRLTFNNGGSNSVAGELVIGGVIGDGGGGNDANITVDNAALSVSTWFSIGRGNGVGGVSSDLVLNNNAVVTAGNISAGFNGGSGANLPKGSVTLNNNSTFTVTGNGAVNFAESPGSAMTMTLNDSAQFIALGTAQKFLGQFGNGAVTLNGSSAIIFGNGTLNVGYRSGTGVVNVASSAALSNGGDLRVGGSDVSGTGNNGYGTLNLNGGSVYAGSLTVARGNDYQNGVAGEVNVNSGTFTSTNDVILGYAGTGHAKLTLGGGGTFHVGTTATKWLALPFYDTTTGEIDITGGALNLNSGSSIKFTVGNTGTAGTPNTINQHGGSVTFYSDFATTVGGGGNLDLQLSGASTVTNTYNLNGGTLTVPQITSTLTTGTRLFNFNGGILKPTASTTAFLQGLTAANVNTGGAKIDTTSHDITIGQALLDGDGLGGGLTKQGLGALTLAGADNYTGPTVVSGGTLLVTPAHQATNSVSVANGATYGVTLPGAFGTVTNAGVTLVAGSTTLRFEVGTNGNTAAPLLVTGPLVNNSTLKVTLGGSVNKFTLGAMPLVKYGAGSVMGTLNSVIFGPNGMSITLSNDSAGSTLYAVINNLGSGLVWTGTNSAAGQTNLWDLNATINWLAGANPVFYQETTPEGDAVTFNDLGSGIVLLSNTASPLSVTISNAAVNYTFAGSGHISGTAGLTKLGTGTAAMNLVGNNYTGPTVVSDGTLSISGGQAIGDSSAVALADVATAALVVTNGESIGSLAGGGNTGGNVTINGGTLTAGGNGASATFGGKIGGAGALAMVSTTGTLTLSGANSTYSGGTSLGVNVAGQRNGVIRAAATQALGSGLIAIGFGGNDATARLELSGGISLNNTVDLAGRNNTSLGIANISGNNTLSGQITMSAGGSGYYIQSDAGLLTLGTTFGPAITTTGTGARTVTLLGAGNGNVAGIINDGAGVVGIVKDGSGTWTLSNLNVNSGPTTVNNGTLLVNGSIYTGAVTVNGGTLGGTGIIGGAVTVNSGGTLSPGTSLGTLTINGNITLNAGSTSTFEVNGTTLAKDVVAAGASVTYGGVLKIVPTGTFTVGSSFVLFSGTGATNASNFASIEGSPGAGLAYSFNNGVLSVVNGVPSTPTNITYSVSGTTLSLSWPAEYLGWYAQSNAVSITDTGAWHDIPDSQTATSLNITIDSAEPKIFYRLRQP
jgi:fibronectin-binding autotransporter adhesin